MCVCTHAHARVSPRAWHAQSNFLPLFLSSLSLSLYKYTQKISIYLSIFQLYFLIAIQTGNSCLLVPIEGGVCMKMCKILGRLSRGPKGLEHKGLGHCTVLSSYGRCSTHQVTALSPGWFQPTAEHKR